MNHLRLTVIAAIVLASTAALWSGEPPEVQRRELGNLVIEDIPDMPKRIIERMQQYQNTRSASMEDWDHAGGIIIATRFGETTQLHQVAGPGADRRQLTFFSEPIASAAVSPDRSKNGLLYTKDVGGGEFHQVYHFDLDRGTHTLLSDGASRNGAVQWSHKGDRFCYYSTLRNGSDWDIYISRVETPQQGQVVLSEGGAWVPVDWSPDDGKLLVNRNVSANESYYYVLDLATSKLTQINPTAEIIAYGPARWAAGGAGVFMTSDQGSEFQRLRYYDMATSAFEDLTADIPWDVDGLAISDDWSTLAFTTNEDGASRVYLLDTQTRRRTPVANLPAGVIGGLKFHSGGKRLAMVINAPRSPGDVYVYDLAASTLARWTFSEVGGLRPEIFAEPELVHYPTFDSDGGSPRMIPALYYKPAGKPGPHPVLISIHGGPEGQYRPQFSSTVQYYVNELGFAVIAPNVRGSTGYGKSYLKMDNAQKREDSVRDIGKLLDWVGTRPELDASRVAVMGGSYGGYMVLACMVHYADRLKAGIDVVGISNFVTFLENTQDYRRDLRRVEYGDERDPQMRKFLLEISPATQAHKINRPMLIVQGLNDPRVPASESEQIVAAIRKNGNMAWYLLAKDEGHGFRKKTNRDFYENAVVLFLETFLRGTPEAPG